MFNYPPFFEEPAVARFKALMKERELVEETIEDEETGVEITVRLEPTGNKSFEIDVDGEHCRPAGDPQGMFDTLAAAFEDAVDAELNDEDAAENEYDDEEIACIVSRMLEDFLSDYEPDYD